MLMRRVMGNRGVDVSAPGKINLILRVLDRRADRYHNLYSVMQAFDLADTIHTEEAPAEAGIRLSCEGAELPVGQDNLVYRAAKAVLLRLSPAAGVHIRLHKQLPISAGVGGGSSDAAATIQALSVLLKTGWSRETMAGVGEEIGSDVPFFFYGPAALVEGRGERVTPLRIEGHRWLVLLNPGIAIATSWAYQRLADVRSNANPPPPDRRSLSVPTNSLIKWDDLLNLVENDFQAVAEEAHPLLREIRLLLITRGAEAAMLCGSGSTVVGVFSSEEKARQVAEGIDCRPGWRIWVTRTSVKQDPPRVLN
jgi:4-diphosphocytidyl-2-C-methyl-D-erythritol kinase